MPVAVRGASTGVAQRLPTADLACVGAASGPLVGGGAFGPSAVHPLEIFLASLFRRLGLVAHGGEPTEAEIEPLPSVGRGER